MKTIVLACDKFKGSLSAQEVNATIAQAFQPFFPEAKFKSCVIADGGEGFVQALVEAAGGEIRTSIVEDALGRDVEAEWGVIPQGDGQLAAVIEMSAASGLWRIAEEEREIMKASSYGTGQLMEIAAQAEGVNRLYLGLGGSATNDGGTGMAQALGSRFYIEEELVEERMNPELLAKVTRIDRNNQIPLPLVTVACDVDSPLCGDTGASVVFGPQKGASTSQVPLLDTYLSQLSDILNAESLAVTPGAGAAGGMGFGLLAFADAELVSGFSLVSDAIRLEAEIAAADLVITGEGKLDTQSLAGKGPIGVAQLASQHGVPCFAIAGGIDEAVDWTPYFADFAYLGQSGLPLQELMTNTKTHLLKTSQQLAERASLIQ